MPNMSLSSKAILSLGLLAILGAAVPAPSPAPKLELPEITPDLLASFNVHESIAAFNWTADPEFLKYLEEEQSLMEVKYIKDPVSHPP
jgi:hypothetical protein